MKEDEVGRQTLSSVFDIVHPDTTPEPEPEPEQPDMIVDGSIEDVYAPMPGLTIRPLGVVGHSKGGDS